MACDNKQCEQFLSNERELDLLIITFSSASGTGCMIVSLHDCFIANVAIFLFRTSIIGSIFDNCSCSGTYATTTCGLYGRSATAAG